MNVSCKDKAFPTARLKYFFIHGLIIRGFCSSVVYSILTLLFHPRISYSIDQIIVRFIAYTLIFSVGGTLITYMQWSTRNKLKEESRI